MNPLMRRLLKQLWKFVRQLAWIYWHSWWWSVRTLPASLIIIAALFYLWACFGADQPQRRLSEHHPWPVFDQAMNNIQEKGCSR